MNNETGVVPLTNNGEVATVLMGQEHGLAMRDNAVKATVGRITRGLEIHATELRAKARAQQTLLETAVTKLNDLSAAYLEDEKNQPARFRKAVAQVQKAVAPILVESDKDVKKLQLLAVVSDDSQWSLVVSNTYGPLVLGQEYIVWNSQIKAQEATAEALRVQVCATRHELGVVETKLLRMPAIRAAIESSVAEASLKATDEGRALLDSVGSSFGDFVDADLQEYLK